jgi:CRISPR-associated protein Cas2
MLVIATENLPPKLRGYLSSWGLQIATGVYVANLPARTRDEIWATVVSWARPDTTAVLLWGTSSTEQGIAVRSLGRPRRRVAEIEGLLVSTWIPREEEAGSSK